MSNHIDACTAILAQAMRITAQGKWHVFCDYVAHVECLSVRIQSADTDYQDENRTMPEDMRAYLTWGETAQQLADIRAELDKLEGGE